MQSTSQIRVRYAETDQMGVAYHANYLVWCEVGRTEFIRQLGVSYAEMEAAGVKLAVADAHLRYRAAARYDDEITITTRLTSARSRMVAFAYRLTRRRPDGGEELGAWPCSSSSPPSPAASTGSPAAGCRRTSAPSR
jgi:YbgC/YbaW family acyl-CoA thioester hydrolase